MLIQPTIADNWTQKVCKAYLEKYADCQKYYRVIMWFKNGIIIFEKHGSEQTWDLKDKLNVKDVKWQNIECTVGYYTNKIGELVEVEPCPVCGCDPELRVDLETNKFYTTDPSAMIPPDVEISNINPKLRQEWFEDTELFNTPEAALAAWNAEGKKNGRKTK